MNKFTPTEENLKVLACSLTLDHVSYLLREVLLRVSHDGCTKYALTVDSEGVVPSATIVGTGYLEATKTNELNLRGEWIL